MQKITYTAAFLAIAAAALFGKLATAQQRPVPTAFTKIGVVNVGYVFSNYVKMKKLYQEIEPRSDEAEKLKKVVVDWQTALESNKLTAEQTEQGKNIIKDCKRRLDEIRVRYQNGLGKNNEDRLLAVYKEVDVEIKRYAESQGYSLILGYGEPGDEELLSFGNITRKLEATEQGAIVPVYATAWIDISRPVLEKLNRDYAASRAP